MKSRQTYNGRREWDLKDWREAAGDLGEAIVAVWNDEATPAQHEAVDAWIQRAWHLDTKDLT